MMQEMGEQNRIIQWDILSLTKRKVFYSGGNKTNPTLASFAPATLEREQKSVADIFFIMIY